MNEGILSQNHRSIAFMAMMRDCIETFKQKLNIPEKYTVYFTSSATECWEIVSQSLVKNQSHHIFNGAFGEKWLDYNSKIHPNSTSQKFDFQESFIDSNLIPSSAEIVCITQNETSNATQISTDFLENINSETLVAIDVTSSLGGIELDWEKGDIWLASVQKCLGLPAGLGVMICSGKALNRAKEINDRKYYNSLLFIEDNFKKFQTHYTPNVLGIYLLKRVMQQVADIQIVSSQIKARAEGLFKFIEEETSLSLLIENKAVRSETVIAIKGNLEEISLLKQKAKENNIILGNGYGEWKDTTFRIANFPAIADWEFDNLKTLLKT